MTRPEPTLIHNARIIGPDRVTEGDVLLADGRIAAVGSDLRPQGPRRLDATGRLLLPGFIEMHCHGGVGFDATCGRYLPEADAFDASEAAYAEGLSDFLRHLAAHGATRALVATAAAPMGTLCKGLRLIAEQFHAPTNGRTGCRLEGAFIEGTFIKRPECAGAQNPEFFHPPTPETFERLDEAAEGRIRYVNVVPEYGDPAVTLTRRLTDRGILVGAGHTRCRADRYRRLVGAGLRVAVHFTNGPTGSSYKAFHGGDAVEAVLSSDEVYAELIADGYHVDRRYVRDIVQRKGAERVIIVTDALFAAGLPDLDEFTFLGMAGAPSRDGAYLRVVGKENTLFGSVITPDVAYGHMLSWLTREMPGVWNRTHPALRPDEALVATSRMISTNPAEVLGLAGTNADGGPTGRIEAGAAADLVLADLAGEPGRYALRVERTFVGGREVPGEG